MYFSWRNPYPFIYLKPEKKNSIWVEAPEPLACVASVSARVRRERRDESKKKATQATEPLHIGHHREYAPPPGVIDF